MNLLGLALAAQMFFPIFDNSTGNYASLALTNVSTADAEFTLRLMSPSGQETNTVRIPIGAGQQRIIGIDTLRPSSDTPREGWISVDATTDHFKAYIVTGTVEALAGIEPVRRPAQTNYLPQVRVRTYLAGTDQTDTSIAIINPSEQPADVTIRLASYDRSISQTVFESVPARGSRLIRVSGLLPSGTTFEGRATVHSFSPLAVWQKIKTLHSWTALRARSEADFGLDTSLTAPFFVFGGVFQSSLTLWNPAEPAITVEASAYNSQGLPIGEPARITLEPGQALSKAVDSLFRIAVIATVPPPAITGSIRLREINNRPFRLFATMETKGFGITDEASMVYWLDSSAAHAWEIPFVAQNERFYTGFSILAANPTATSPTDVAIEVHDLNGVLVQRLDRSLAPGALDAELIAPSAPGAYIRIWATQPISVIGSIGSLNGNSFEAVMPSR